MTTRTMRAEAPQDLTKSQVDHIRRLREAGGSAQVRGSAFASSYCGWSRSCIAALERRGFVKKVRGSAGVPPKVVLTADGWAVDLGAGQAPLAGAA